MQAKTQASLFKPHGRISRLTFIAWNAVLTAIVLLAVVFILKFDPGLINLIFANINSLTGLKIVAFVLYLPIIYMSMVFGIKRLHDLNHSGWLVLLNFIPIVNFFFALYILLKPGHEGLNKFGQERSPKPWEILVGWLVIIITSVALISALSMIVM